MIITAQHLQEGRKYGELTDRSGVAVGQRARGNQSGTAMPLG